MRTLVLALVLVLTAAASPAAMERLADPAAPSAVAAPTFLAPALLMSPAISSETGFRFVDDCPILYYCPWYIDIGCSCELIYCFGSWQCGVPWNGLRSPAKI